MFKFLLFSPPLYRFKLNFILYGPCRIKLSQTGVAFGLGLIVYIFINDLVASGGHMDVDDDSEDWLRELIQYNRQAIICCIWFSHLVAKQSSRRIYMPDFWSHVACDSIMHGQAKDPPDQKIVSVQGLPNPIQPYGCLQCCIFFLYTHELDSRCPAVLPRRHKRLHWEAVLDKGVLSLERTRDCFEKISGDPILDYDLPHRPNLLPGQILKHCYEKVDQILASHAPCTHKVGYTHCAHFRWHNNKFGYKHCREKWEKMLVLYAASETISPSFVEAALIQRLKGFLNACRVPSKHYIYIYKI